MSVAAVALTSLLIALSTVGGGQETTVRACVQDAESGEALRATFSLRSGEDLDERGHVVVHRPWTSVETDELGCADLRLEDESIEVTVWGPQHFARELDLDPRTTQRVDVELERFETRRQEVLVVDRVTGEPVEDARVMFEWGGARGGPGSPETRTDVLGRAVFEALPDGPYWLQVAGQPRIEYFQEELTLTPERGVLEVPVRLHPRVLVVGRVVDSSGAPVVGARIRGARHRSRAWTDEEGRFEVYAYATRTAFVTATKPGLGNARAEIRSEGVDWDVVDVGELRLEKGVPLRTQPR